MFECIDDVEEQVEETRVGMEEEEDTEEKDEEGRVEGNGGGGGGERGEAGRPVF